MDLLDRLPPPGLPRHIDYPPASAPIDDADGCSLAQEHWR
jgi:hypothetical protein